MYELDAAGRAPSSALAEGPLRRAAQWERQAAVTALVVGQPDHAVDWAAAHAKIAAARRTVKPQLAMAVLSCDVGMPTVSIQHVSSGSTPRPPLPQTTRCSERFRVPTWRSMSALPEFPKLLDDTLGHEALTFATPMRPTRRPAASPREAARTTGVAPASTGR
jgi:hypothetical protein